MGQRTQATAGCLSALAGLGLGLAVWFGLTEGRVHRFETGPDWRLVYLALPVCLAGGIAVGTLGGLVLQRLLRPRRQGPPDPG
ncbi:MULTISPECIES: hypothetical protein [unclassified Streptomyces]|uniref:hypothetical protein n=1 Tax=unclassified Streptomyces TaxID=2593676 RepID=UPI000DBA47B2|nr:MULTISPECIES: hypothetical protein [unclassified Streptomyces]MYT69968.1 hypothetical protein [Streptomyces sp. SID8367]RAJ88543.1 hypothetical protein K377_01998 [Streptomyces sp. PsTaAH-137]